MGEEQRANGLREYHERIPDAYRAGGWRVLAIAVSPGEAEGGIGPTLYTAVLSNRSAPDAPRVQSGVCRSREEAVDDAVRELMRLEPLA